MHEEAYSSPSSPNEMATSPARSRNMFSCSPRDFRLPLSAVHSDSENSHTRRTGSRRRIIPRDKNKLRVSEMLHGEHFPADFEVASEARLQRHIDRRTRTAPYATPPPHAWERPPHEARVASLFGPLRHGVYEVPAAPRDAGCELDEDLCDDFPSTPLDLTDAYSSDEAERIDEDPRSSPMDVHEDLLLGAAGMSMHATPMPVPGAADSPQLGAKRKHESIESPGWGAARRRGPVLLAGRKAAPRTPGPLSTSPRSTSPRRMSLLMSQGAFVSPSSSPLALGEPRRRAATPGASGLTGAPLDTPALPISRPTSPSNAWLAKTHSRSPSHSGSGPGYGSGAIGLRLGQRSPWEGVPLNAWLDEQVGGKEVDEGVKSLGLG
ncbi:uncharacterized protein MJAP1_002700 [Malassezia japonica]|uniref:Uncharacterized protein n=1 Tax=Malassezia japonica TaxID=223818 RepID=A0AAF0JBA9_9BASI|nr:uncharacterized protein MJAP1_002700 [Malassezia japonica]WFD39719.1 hypothetical protein MJAP1_002700 [Malassezia japonica]